MGTLPHPRPAGPPFKKVQTTQDLETSSPEEAFDREWAVTCLKEGRRLLREELMKEGRARWWRVFEAYYEKDPLPSYVELAERLGLQSHDVSNGLVYARKRLKRIVQELVRETVSSRSELAEELHHVLGK